VSDTPADFLRESNQEDEVIEDIRKHSSEKAEIEMHKEEAEKLR